MSIFTLFEMNPYICLVISLILFIFSLYSKNTKKNKTENPKKLSNINKQEYDEKG